MVFKTPDDEFRSVLSMLLLADVCQCCVKSIFLGCFVLITTCCEAKSEKVET